MVFHFPFISVNGIPYLSQTELEIIIPEIGNAYLIWVLVAELPILGMNQAIVFFLFLQILCWRRSALSICSVCYYVVQVTKQHLQIDDGSWIYICLHILTASRVKDIWDKFCIIFVFLIFSKKFLWSREKNVNKHIISIGLPLFIYVM